MFTRLGKLVTRHWLLVILAWIALLVGLRAVAPGWDTIMHDGDLAYLPAEMPSVVGERLMAEAFPHDWAKSQIVLVVARQPGPLSREDLYVAYDVARRFANLQGAGSLQRARQSAARAETLQRQGQAEQAQTARRRTGVLLEAAREALDEAIRLDEQLAHYHLQRADDSPETAALPIPPRLAEAFYNRALLHDHCRDPAEAEADRQRALALDPALAGRGSQLAPDGAADWPLLDVWTWRDEPFGRKLGRDHPHARLVVLQLSNEFMAADNIRVLEQVEAELDAARQYAQQWAQPGLAIGLSGSAAVGGDMLRSAAEGIKNTELCTVLLVVLILALVYRAPLLVVVPLLSIATALMVSTSAVALLTRLDALPGMDWWHLKVFTTSRIFIVVILFGAGTDYCLFLISRYKEELAAGYESAEAVTRALGAVGDALAASALTTIFGLAMMFFADFGKFRYSGPVIGFCLAITLLTCVTLTPALLRGVGRAVFWPFGVPELPLGNKNGAHSTAPPAGRQPWLWPTLARWIVAYPGRILIVSVLLLMPVAGYGWQSAHHVTYDFLHELSANQPSKQGAALLRQHFPVGESAPLTVLVHKQGARFDSKAGRSRIGQLGQELYVDGVTAVRSLHDPLGDYPPGARIGLVSSRSWRTRLLRPHRRTEQLFVAQQPPLQGQVTRLEVVLQPDPFSPEAARVLGRVDQALQSLQNQPDSYWADATFAYTGTTAGIRDLRIVTQADNSRIMILVVLAVLAVLLVILKRPLVCLYMVATVLLSYYVTIGATEWFFGWAYGDSFHGLDWKVPLFLFVILVAIGQDYNVYLATRVFEEQQRYGPFGGLRRAIVQTGGIITSCGVIMAGTFFSMTSGTWGAVLPGWLPWTETLLGTGGVLRGIVELGFALALGVMLDTFVVRPVLMPSMLALLCRWQEGFNRWRLPSVYSNVACKPGTWSPLSGWHGLWRR